LLYFGDMSVAYQPHVNPFLCVECPQSEGYRSEENQFYNSEPSVVKDKGHILSINHYLFNSPPRCRDDGPSDRYKEKR
jgi:hypothetical protein